ncbi:hypothetical protein V9T40_002521 [Parthenolecanium corni]|uniref:Dynein axonemal assembly factor 1 homolog n=1 Tax=Parthenolecanium corni TaxID=536013 RepID=A0AAN9TGD2_9HEMI
MAPNQLLDGINNVMFLKNFLCDQLCCEVEKLDFKKVYKFELEHKNLLRINCLWPLSNLTHLSLADNRLTKIENLESLISLKELNLSFNQIRKIENLHTLINLQKLLLNSNQIQLLENLDRLKRLKILNVSANCIKDTYFPYYLCQFKELRALMVHENPCYLQNDEINKSLIALLPQLFDLNYRRISDKERYSAKIHHKMKILGHRRILSTDLEAPGTLYSKYKALSKRKTDFWQITGDEFCDFLFQNFKALAELSDEGENFRRLNEKLREKIVSLFQELLVKKNSHNENIKHFEENYKDLEMKSLEVKRKCISSVKSDSMPIEVGESTLNNVRMSLLAEECTLHHDQQKLLEEMNDNLSAEIKEFYDCVKNIHQSIETEIFSYVKAITKNIESCFQWKTNVPYEFQPTSKENIFYNVNLKEFFAVFEGSCIALINESETRHIEVIREWKDQFSKMLRKNVVRHRKAVAEIIELIESLKMN